MLKNKPVCQKTNEIDESYFFMNVLGNIKSFDRNKSIYTTYPETDIIHKVEKLVIDDDTVKGKNIFRIFLHC